MRKSKRRPLCYTVGVVVNDTPTPIGSMPVLFLLKDAQELARDLKRATGTKFVVFGVYINKNKKVVKYEY